MLTTFGSNFGESIMEDEVEEYVPQVEEPTAPDQKPDEAKMEDSRPVEPAQVESNEKPAPTVEVIAPENHHETPIEVKREVKVE